MPPANEKILETTGFSRLVRDTTARRKISVKGIQPLAAGVWLRWCRSSGGIISYP